MGVFQVRRSHCRCAPSLNYTDVENTIHKKLAHTRRNSARHGHSTFHQLLFLLCHVKVHGASYFRAKFTSTSVISSYFREQHRHNIKFQFSSPCKHFQDATTSRKL